MKDEREIQLNKRLIAALVLSVILALSVLGGILSATGARYVVEVDGNGDLPFETQTPFNVDSQSALVNAVQSGYGYVKLSDDLKGPLIITGDTLNLIRDLTIDLNGKEIQRTATASLLTVTAGNSLNIIDTAGGGGLYNPVGSALTVDGGDLNVYGGIFESGPRPEEYFTNLNREAHDSAVDFNFVARRVNSVKRMDGGTLGQDYRLILPIRESSTFSSYNTGSIYFDVDSSGTVESTRIPKDTYCFTVIKGETNDEFATFDTEAADFAYSYFTGSDGRYRGFVGPDQKYYAYTGDANDSHGDEDGNYVPSDVIPADVREVMVFGFTNDIAKSALVSRGGVVTDRAPQYAAIRMLDGSLNVEVTGSQSKDTRKAGSFYSYFGTWQTYCIYINGGTMNVNSTGEIKTVDPARLPALTSDELAPITENGKQVGYKGQGCTAKFSESACIFSEAVKVGDNYTSGTLNVSDMNATSYNGSVISVGGGFVNMSNANITKNMTFSHFNSPFEVDEQPPDTSTGSQFPSDRQYRDAALFVNGGQLNLSGTAAAVGREAKVKIEVTKSLNGSLLPESLGRMSFGILSRGRQGFNSAFTGSDVDIVMHDAYSYGVFGTRGEISLVDSTITLDSDVASYGVYAVNKTSLVNNLVNINLTRTNVTLGAKTTYEGALAPSTSGSNWYDNVWLADGSGGTMRVASIGVYLDSHEFAGGSVTVNNSNIVSQELGVSVYGGNLTFKNDCDIEAYNASAVTLRGGDIVFENNGTESAPSVYNVISNINRKTQEGTTSCSVSGDANIKNPGLHQYGIYLPYMYDEVNQVATEYANDNGIRVSDGNLISYGKLAVNFRGLYNDVSQFGTDYNTSVSNFEQIVIKSFAVACINDNQASSAANVRIDYADITATVGGGVKVQGGDITLGRAGSTNNDDVSVKTTGYRHLNLACVATPNEKAASWQFYPGLNNGYAVVARGGSMTVNCGTYSAAYCDAAAVSSDAGKRPAITINGGYFDGKWTHDSTTMYNAFNTSGIRVTSDASSFCLGGPACYYGLKVLGESDVNVNGGIFTGRNGGLLVRGTAASLKTTVKVSAGQFGTEGAGQDGVNVFDYSDVYFGTLVPESGKVLTAEQCAGLKVYARFYSIATNPVVKTGNSINVYVYYGQYYLSDAGNTRGIGSVGTLDTTFRIYGLYTNTMMYKNSVWSSSENTGLFASSAMRRNDQTVTGTVYGFRQTTPAKNASSSTVQRYFGYTGE